MTQQLKVYTHDLWITGGTIPQHIESSRKIINSQEYDVLAFQRTPTLFETIFVPGYHKISSESGKLCTFIKRLNGDEPLHFSVSDGQSEFTVVFFERYVFINFESNNIYCKYFRRTN